MVCRSGKLENDERDIKFPFLLHQRQHRAPLNYVAHGVVFTRRDERNYTVDRGSHFQISHIAVSGARRRLHSLYED